MSQRRILRNEGIVRAEIWVVRGVAVPTLAVRRSNGTFTPANNRVKR